jgi:hypothetical protein
MGRFDEVKFTCEKAVEKPKNKKNPRKLSQCIDVFISYLL